MLNHLNAYRLIAFSSQAGNVTTSSRKIASADTDHKCRDGFDDVPSRNPVLIVDDDQSMCEMVTEYFANHNVPVYSASDHRDFVRYFAAASFSVVILDLNLSDGDGLELLREIRSNSDVPVIIITGQRLSDADRVIGLELGADDYIVKPFSLRELLARVRAVLRRQGFGWAMSSSRDRGRGGYRFGGWQLDCCRRWLVNPGGTRVVLNRIEHSLLLAFLEAPQCVLSREQLKHATRTHEDTSDRSIDVRVLRLRRKLATERGAPSVIRTERGVGYIFTLRVERL